ncbi:MAG: major capsid protein [Microvirus sp.]|nr:MAG: major capsid protein [Microvirus sp.]
MEPSMSHPLPSVMKHNFSQVPKAEIQRSSFDRSHGCKTTFDAGYLVPVFVDEALPGDTFNVDMTAFARMATPIFPIMDNLFMDSFFFAVPIRLIWDNWKKFNGEQVNPGDSTDFLIPQMVSPAGGYIPDTTSTATTANLAGALSDYFGLPTRIAGVSHSSLWHRAYNLIWNEWFRDENLQNSVVVNKGDGPDTYTDYPLLRRGKRHDYFTSCLPWPQKGPSVPLPLTGNAPVISNHTGIKFATTANNSGEATAYISSAAGNPLVASAVPNNSIAFFGSNSGLTADLSAITAATINQLRQSFQIQRLYERDARGGTRYTEIVKAHFLVTSPDARLQRPEYLGGGSSPVSISSVAQTSSTNAQPTPLGNLAAFGTAVLHNHGFTHSFTEHCVVIGLVSVRADLSYQNGLNRMFSRRTRWDYFWPALSHIGEQAVLNKEIYCDGSANDALTFGYQERYAEYRYKPSIITGKLRSNDPVPLDAWHLAQKFLTLPTLSASFIVDNPPISRIVAVPSQPAFIFDSYIKFIAARPMPTYGVPGLIDHF